MSHVLNKVREVDPNDSEAVKDAVNTFFQNLPKIDNSECIKWLRTLEDVINRFPKYCMSHRPTIENLIREAIDSNNYYCVIEAAKCAQAVQQVRPSQEKTATPKTSWRDQMNLLCDAAHSLITVIFPNAVDIYKGSKNSKGQDLNTSSTLTKALLNIKTVGNNKNKGEKQTVLRTRLKNIFCFIQAMLVEIYPVAKPVRPQIILDVVVRALSVSSGKNADFDVAFIKIEALRTLDALVACLGPNLIPYLPLVFRLLMQTFRWTSENTEKDFSAVRCAAYNSVRSWLNTLHSHRSAADNRSAWEDDLTNHIMADTAAAEKIVELTMGPQPTKHMSKKAKRKLANAKLLESSIAAHMPGEKNKLPMPNEVDNSVAMAALECAETFLLVCGRFLKPATHKLFQERAARECYSANSYKDDQLLALLRMLEASRKTAPATVPPPTQYCLKLYSNLINSRHAEISKFCTQHLLEIRMHLHCSPPSLNFALEASQEKQGAANKRKKISERNMTVLKSLLGPDRMSALVSEEIVTIPDEPSFKKARLDEDVDKISVSSGMTSHEISDDSDVLEVEGESEIEEEVNKTTGNVIVETAIIEYTDKSPQPDSNNGKDATDSVASTTEIIPEKTKEIDTEKMEVETEEIVTESSLNVDEQKGEIEKDDVVKAGSLHEAATQSNLTDDEAEAQPSSLDIAYDDPKSETVVIISMAPEPEPCSSETDDLIISCGQAVKSSQETYQEMKSDDTDVSLEINVVTKINGNMCASEAHDVEITADIAKDLHNAEQNIKIDEADESGETIKEKGEENDPNEPLKNAVSIEEMMADFVDEVNEDVVVA